MSNDPRAILSRQGYKELKGACLPPCTLWQGPNGRRVLLTPDDGIINKAEVERRAYANCGPDTRDYYLSVVHNWD